MKKTILFSVLFALSAQANDFAFRLYERLSDIEGNLFFSPASIEAALAMTQEGEAGRTRDQLSALLPEHSIFPRVGTHVTLESANALWVEKTVPVLGSFEQAVTGTYGAEIHAADFKGQPDAERQTVNRWVEEKTRDKIQDLLAEGSVDTLTRLILVNAIYFKGDWLRAFDPNQTVSAPFHTPEEIQINVPMMTMAPERFGYLENDCFQCLELPYLGDEVSMRILLPREPEGLAHIENNFSVETLEACSAPLRKTKVKVHLPRFKIATQLDTLKTILSELGLTDAFDPKRADFSGISPETLFISDVIHKAFVEVNEEGTEAAAATGITIGITSMPAPPKTFRADRPFLFLIRDKASGTILFMGRMANPLK